MAMAFADWIASAVGSGEGAAGYLGSAATRGTVVRAGLNEGLTPTAILGAMRDAGLGMRTQNFYRLVNEMTAAPETAAMAGAAPVSGAVASGDVVALEGGREGQFMVNVRMYYQKVDQFGDVERGYTTTSIIQRGAPDLESALGDAQDLWTSIKPGDTDLGQLLGAEVSGVYQWQG